MAYLQFHAEYCVMLSVVMIIEWLAVLGLILPTWIAFGSYFQNKKNPMYIDQRFCWIQDSWCMRGWLWTPSWAWAWVTFLNLKSNCLETPSLSFLSNITIKSRKLNQLGHSCSGWQKSSIFQIELDNRSVSHLVRSWVQSVSVVKWSVRLTDSVNLFCMEQRNNQMECTKQQF